jgi:hypothetical protein
MLKNLINLVKIPKCLWKNMGNLGKPQDAYGKAWATNVQKIPWNLSKNLTSLG